MSNREALAGAAALVAASSFVATGMAIVIALIIRGEVYEPPAWSDEPSCVVTVPHDLGEPMFWACSNGVRLRIEVEK